jgi:hypothetical protein
MITGDKKKKLARCMLQQAQESLKENCPNQDGWTKERREDLG